MSLCDTTRIRGSEGAYARCIRIYCAADKRMSSRTGYREPSSLGEPYHQYTVCISMHLDFLSCTRSNMPLSYDVGPRDTRRKTAYLINSHALLSAVIEHAESYVFVTQPTTESDHDDQCSVLISVNLEEERSANYLLLAIMQWGCSDHSTFVSFRAFQPTLPAGSQ